MSLFLKTLPNSFYRYIVSSRPIFTKSTSLFASITSTKPLPSLNAETRSLCLANEAKKRFAKKSNKALKKPTKITSGPVTYHLDKSQVKSFIERAQKEQYDQKQDEKDEQCIQVTKGSNTEEIVKEIKDFPIRQMTMSEAIKPLAKELTGTWQMEKPNKPFGLSSTDKDKIIRVVDIMTRKSKALLTQKRKSSSKSFLPHEEDKTNDLTPRKSGALLTYRRKSTSKSDLPCENKKQKEQALDHEDINSICKCVAECLKTRGKKKSGKKKIAKKGKHQTSKKRSRPSSKKSKSCRPCTSKNEENEECAEGKDEGQADLAEDLKNTMKKLDKLEKDFAEYKKKTGKPEDKKACPDKQEKKAGCMPTPKLDTQLPEKKGQAKDVVGGSKELIKNVCDGVAAKSKKQPQGKGKKGAAKSKSAPTLSKKTKFVVNSKSGGQCTFDINPDACEKKKEDPKKGKKDDKKKKADSCDKKKRDKSKEAGKRDKSADSGKGACEKKRADGGKGAKKRDKSADSGKGACEKKRAESAKGAKKRDKSGDSGKGACDKKRAGSGKGAKKRDKSGDSGKGACGKKRADGGKGAKKRDKSGDSGKGAKKCANKDEGKSKSKTSLKACKKGSNDGASKRSGRQIFPCKPQEEQKQDKGGDPCSKDNVKSKKADPCSKNVKKEDPCSKKEDKGKKGDPCAKGKDKKATDPCAKSAQKGGKQIDPCAKGKDKKAADPCGGKSSQKGSDKIDPCAKGKDKKALEGGKSSQKGGDPCAKKSGQQIKKGTEACSKDKKKSREDKDKDLVCGIVKKAVDAQKNKCDDQEPDQSPIMQCIALCRKEAQANAPQKGGHPRDKQPVNKNRDDFKQCVKYKEHTADKIKPFVPCQTEEILSGIRGKDKKGDDNTCKKDKKGDDNKCKDIKRLLLTEYGDNKRQAAGDRECEDEEEEDDECDKPKNRCEELEEKQQCEDSVKTNPNFKKMPFVCCDDKKEASGGDCEEEEKKSCK